MHSGLTIKSKYWILMFLLMFFSHSSTLTDKRKKDVQDNNNNNNKIDLNKLKINNLSLYSVNSISYP